MKPTLPAVEPGSRPKKRQVAGLSYTCRMSPSSSTSTTPISSGETYGALDGELTQDPAYGMNAVYPHGHHGNAILSRWTIDQFTNHDVSDHALEKRGLLHAVARADGHGAAYLDRKSTRLNSSHSIASRMPSSG